MKKIAILASLLFIISPIFAQLHLQISPNSKMITPPAYGLFFEDINFAADGGLYAELVKNRSFEFDKPLTGWREINKNTHNQLLVINRSTQNANNGRYIHIKFSDNEKPYQLVNEGFRGIGIKENAVYDFYITAKSSSPTLSIKVNLVTADGQLIGDATLTHISAEWKEYHLSFSATAKDAKAKLTLTFLGNGNIDADMISLFPHDTWKNRPKGLRKDLVSLLYDMKPGFLRFPGGCIVEGRDLLNRYQWKNTVGHIDDRKLLINRWNTEFSYRSAPDYFQTFGLGFYEYFLLAEDIGASPLPIINCGMACQFNSAEVASLTELDPYIQDALDLIAFANGDVNNKWGKLRAEMGHPKPFNMKLLGVGNEQWDPQYIERYQAFEKVLKQQHPEIKLVAAAGPSPDGERFDYAWQQLKNSKADFLDEHYYQNPNWFYNNADRYDHYDRKGPKVFAGEYASHTKDVKVAEGKNNWLSALSEAAFMTGLDRNGEVVGMASYAPLFAQVDAWQWRPDLIWFNNLKAVPTANYYVQQLFSLNRGNQVINITKDAQPLIGKDSLYASASVNTNQKELYIKLVNNGASVIKVDLNFIKYKVAKEVSHVLLQAKDLESYNPIDGPAIIHPETKTINYHPKMTLNIEPQSVNVFTFKVDQPY